MHPPSPRGLCRSLTLLSVGVAFATLPGPWRRRSAALGFLPRGIRARRRAGVLGRALEDVPCAFCEGLAAILDHLGGVVPEIIGPETDEFPSLPKPLDMVRQR